MSGKMPGTDSTTVPWHAAYPAPETVAKSISRDEVLDMMKHGMRDYLLVDLRRADHEGGLIRASINLPAQSLYPSIPTLFRLTKDAGIVKVIWFCASSRGRGPRAAAWFNDYLAKCGETDMESLVLLGGIKGWATAGDEYVSWMDEYEASVWTRE
ncbi:arsenate reductase Arc2 [Trichoderma parareesei]|uniref:Arsenate reductase Arc2 n=1 Tax=Trichoderma parareesei TaxID=858221 RepID=A0A2H2YYQ3_TRIPA|nr:arsenate reductase Arc2 [Trichoderma parareesei]